MRSIKLFFSISAFFAPLLLGSSIVSAQTFGAASIHGKVIDESGAPVPGATVIGRSPALQLPQVVVVSE